jgi:ribosomal protein S18 acetylase RimI-like enzyme
MIVDLVRKDERESLLALSVCTGLFTAEEAEGLLGGVLDALASGELPDGHAAVTCRESPTDPAAGWAYFAPDQYAENVWNVWWIGISPDYHGTGAAQTLLSHVEQTALGSGARVVVIETSDQDAMARARRFYAKVGYTERGRIPDFYAEGESKVLFSRSFASATKKYV